MESYHVHQILVEERKRETEERCQGWDLEGLVLVGIHINGSKAPPIW